VDRVAVGTDRDVERAIDAAESAFKSWSSIPPSKRAEILLNGCHKLQERESDLVKIAEAVHRAMGFDPPIGNAGSNNSSAALLQGINSISTGAGPCNDSHALTENCEIDPLYKGIKKLLLLEVALAGLAP